VIPLAQFRGSMSAIQRKIMWRQEHPDGEQSVIAPATAESHASTHPGFFI
jgi:hypothetical protein